MWHFNSGLFYRVLARLSTEVTYSLLPCMIQPGQSSVAQRSKRAQLNDNSTSASTTCAKRTKLNNSNITVSAATVPADRVRGGGEHDINTDTATNVELLLVISTHPDTDTAMASDSSTEVCDASSPLQLGRAV